MNLVITFDKTAYFFPYVSNGNIKVIEALRSDKKIWRAVRRMPFLYGIAYNPQIKYWAHVADKILIFDSAYTHTLGRYLKKFKDKTRLYIWNPVSKTSEGECHNWVKKAKRYSHLYSFDLDDCRKYEIDFAPMIYSSRVRLPQNQLEYNVLFLGAGKDRLDIFRGILTTLLSKVENCKYIVVQNDPEKTDCQIEYTKKRYSYDEYLKLISKSKVLLDIPQCGQVGNTIRVVESLFFEKKLITTNKDVKTYDFYDPENIFIIGEDESNRIEEFIAAPYRKVKKRILDKYDFEKWIETI